MYKQPKIDWHSTNIHNIGGDADKLQRLKASNSEHAWSNVGKKEGLQIWRINDFKVVAWPEDQYGKFYANDSYIILFTHNHGKPDASYDLHYWLGSTTSQDESGTAAYKTVELDDHLGGKPIQYREVQLFESKQFLSYFPNGIQYLEGGAPSGFHKVEKANVKPRLFVVHGNMKAVRVMEVPLSPSSLSDSDVFLLDAGEEVFEWIGQGATPGEKMKAAQVATTLGYDTDVVEQGDTTGEEAKRFFELLGGVPSNIPSGSVVNIPATREAKKLYHVRASDAGQLHSCDEVSVSRSSLVSADVFLYDVGDRVFVWIGKDTATGEKNNALSYGQSYLLKNNLPPYTALIRVSEGHEGAEFKKLLH
jgi:gelsolin